MRALLFPFFFGMLDEYLRNAQVRNMYFSVVLALCFENALE
jgi:hypothetical protein